MTPLRVCALVPAFNEAGTIAEVVSGVQPFVSATVVVDDGSSDETAARGRAAGATVLVHAKNAGKGHAVRTGLAHILAVGMTGRAGGAGDASSDSSTGTPTALPFTHVLLIDGDMQHRPADVPKLIGAAARTGADLVVGERVFDKAQMPSSRYYSNVIGSWALSGFIGAPIGDSQSGFRLIRCDALRDMPLTATGYEVETEMLIRLARRGARMASVPVTLSYGGAKSKLRPVRDTTRTCFLAVYYRFLIRD